MNAFQLLKSGASFSRERIVKVNKLFKPTASETVTKTDKKPVDEALCKEEVMLNEIDQKL